MEKKTLLWQLFGAIFIVLLGSFMHFLFELTGNWAPIGAIAAVNESVWEHLKLGYFPLIIFALIEYKFLKKSFNQFIVAVASSAIIIPLVIVVFFYSYTTILGGDSLFFDILSFIIAIFIGQYVSYRVLLIEKVGSRYAILALIILIAFGASFVFFTYFPPQLPIFQDSTTSGYGIVS
jgi:hypothetical protein